jgi:tetrahydromethanopterin S-methyltransferase subunit B
VRYGFANLIKYRTRPLADNPKELEELASSLGVSLAYTYRHYGLDIALAQTRIRKALAAFRNRVLLGLALMTVLAVIVVVASRLHS